MSSENRESQESIQRNSQKMMEDAHLKKSHTEIGRSGRVASIQRNPSIPSKDKGGSR